MMDSTVRSDGCTDDPHAVPTATSPWPEKPRRAPILYFTLQIVADLS